MNVHYIHYSGPITVSGPTAWGQFHEFFGFGNNDMFYKMNHRKTAFFMVNPKNKCVEIRACL